MTRHRSQAGLSLVELIIGMAVTSLVLSGIVAMVFTLTNSYNHWVGKVGNASSGDVLAAAIQVDAHRLITCGTTSTEQDFCLVGGTPSVAYCTQGPAPYTVIRAVNCSASAIRNGHAMVRGLTAQPTYSTYHVDCTGLIGVESGYVEVGPIDGLKGNGGLRVYFRRPCGA
jgi:Tfp pilus assembly protein PilE